MKIAVFPHRWLPYVFVAPQLLIVGVFFYYPAIEAIRLSVFLEDPFGLGSTFVGLENFQILFRSDNYRQVAWFTLWYTLLSSALSMALALLLAVKADRVIRGAKAYRSLIMGIYAVAPPAAGLLGVMLFDQHVGPLSAVIRSLGIDFRLGADYNSTAIALVITTVWTLVPIAFVFYIAALQAIPVSLREAALMDCPSDWRRFVTVTFPLLSPTTFFLSIIMVTHTLFDSFGLIDVLTKNSPGNNPVTLVYKVYLDGFRGGDMGGSSAQSLVLMVAVLLLSLLQFRLVERKVTYR
jgi:sn-glycerol 3-phosphate transport system permease protein